MPKRIYIINLTVHFRCYKVRFLYRVEKGSSCEKILGKRLEGWGGGGGGGVVTRKKNFFQF